MENGSKISFFKVEPENTMIKADSIVMPVKSTIKMVRLCLSKS